MDHLEDELDLKYHRGLKPDVYYRCPTLESLDGALRNELEKNAASLIPVDVVTEFIFAASSTITVPVSHQRNLDQLIEPAHHLQSIAVEHALCRDIDGKDRLKIQRAIARSIIEAIQDADGFGYLERSVQNKEGGDGARFRYICQDSRQNRNRKNNFKDESEDVQDDSKESKALPTYDCNGAVHLKFSLKRNAINVVYKHNPIHPKPVKLESVLPALAIAAKPSATPKPKDKAPESNKTQPKKRRKKASAEDDVFATSNDDEPPPARTPKSTKRKKATISTPTSTRTSVAKKQKKSASVASNINPTIIAPSTVKRKACLRCREKKIKCDEAKPTCNQCQRGLWVCEYDTPGHKVRSKTGCLNCKRRRRKCTEEKPSCALCLRRDDDCEYAND